MPLVHSHSIKQSSCNTSIWFISDLQTLHSQVLLLQIRYKPHGCIITVTCISLYVGRLKIDIMNNNTYMHGYHSTCNVFFKAHNAYLNFEGRLQQYSNKIAISWMFSCVHYFYSLLTALLQYIT